MQASDGPIVFFTLKGNPRSEKVIAQLDEHVHAPDSKYGSAECVVLDDAAAAKEYFDNASTHARDHMVVLEDTGRLHRRHFRYIKEGKPDWSCGAHWGVQITEAALSGSSPTWNITCQLAADFLRNRSARLAQGELPWGPAPIKKPHRRGTWSSRRRTTTYNPFF